MRAGDAPACERTAARHGRRLSVRDRNSQLAPGEVLLAYTDGVTEAQDKNHALYSGARLNQLLASAPISSAKAVVDFVRDDVHRFAAGAEQADDITLLAVRWPAPKNPG